MRSAALPCLGLLVAACADEPEAPEPSAPPDPPALRIEAPARGAFLGSGDALLRGRARKGDAPLAALLVDGAEAPIEAGGAFEVPLAPSPGLNLLGVRVEDEAGGRAVDGRAFVWGPVHAPGARIEGALRLVVGPDLSALSEVLALALTDPSVAGALVGVPIETEYAVVTPTAVTVGGGAVDLACGTGAVDGVVTLSDVGMTFDVVGVGWYDWVAVAGSAWADAVTVDLVVAVSASGGAVEAEVTAAEATIDGFGFEVEWVPSFLEEWLYDTVADFIASSVEEQARAAVADTLAGALSGLALDTTFMDTLDLSLALDTVEVQPTGIRLVIDASASAEAGFDLPERAGSPDTEEPVPDWDPASGGNFAVLVDDDLVNQLLFAFWASGAMRDLVVSGEVMGGLTGEPLSEPLGPVRQVRLDVGLPPFLGPPTASDQSFDLAIGEFRVAFDREDGVTLDFSVNAATGAVATFDEDGAIDVTLDARPATVEVEVGVVESDPAVDPGDLAALVRLLVPPLLGRVDLFLPSVEVPALDLGALTDLGSLDGVTLVLGDPTVEITDEGWLRVEGEYAAR